MKNTWFIACIVFIVGCSEPDRPKVGPEQEEPTTIDGLKLEFIESKVEGEATSIYFRNESEGYITCVGGYIYKSTDGGEQWRKVSKDLTFLPINDVYFATDNEGWAVGGRSGCEGSNCVQPPGFLLYTTDGGEHWKKHSFEMSQRTNLTSVRFVNDHLGFAVGDHIILRTVDGGDTWMETIIEDLPALMKSVQFFDDKHGVITGTMGILVRTEDGGDTWNAATPFPQMGQNSLSVTSGIAFSAGYTSMHRSTDYGKTWNPVPLATENIRTVSFATETWGIAFGTGNWSGGDMGYSRGSLYYTTDGAATWKGSSDIKETKTIFSSTFPSGSVGYALAAGGIVVKVTVK